MQTETTNRISYFVGAAGIVSLLNFIGFILFPPMTQVPDLIYMATWGIFLITILALSLWMAVKGKNRLWRARITAGLALASTMLLSVTILLSTMTEIYPVHLTFYYLLGFYLTPVAAISAITMFLPSRRSQ
ncbi:hypothetical protein [Boudabousia marimammalium]|uniref:Uncharacterized protein n=1 Tax=Boudabousia marimammalium TaxID=156892 RepID=A0A1Q5PT83_9ACTO|nr:hypothetical protein [Boudabousia marimammalium]OKL50590.1 hypothetical protein BM477_01110 [Boudabousia marimammalium]